MTQLALAAVQVPGVFLTNALTGRVPKMEKRLPFPALVVERDRAERVKRETPIVGNLGNPPYNGYAGVADVERRRHLRPKVPTERAR